MLSFHGCASNACLAFGWSQTAWNKGCRHASNSCLCGVRCVFLSRLVWTSPGPSHTSHKGAGEQLVLLCCSPWNLREIAKYGSFTIWRHYSLSTWTIASYLPYIRVSSHLCFLIISWRNTCIVGRYKWINHDTFITDKYCNFAFSLQWISLLLLILFVLQLHYSDECTYKEVGLCKDLPFLSVLR